MDTLVASMDGDHIVLHSRSGTNHFQWPVAVTVYPGNAVGAVVHEVIVVLWVDSVVVVDGGGVGGVDVAADNDLCL
jgi:hypothetical protein